MRFHGRGNHTTWGFDARPDDADWREKAACRDRDPELWFHDNRGPVAKEATEQAKRICFAYCTVRRDCRAWVMAHPQEFGVWAGLTPDERRYFAALRERFATADEVARERFGDPKERRA